MNKKLTTETYASNSPDRYGMDNVVLVFEAKKSPRYTNDTPLYFDLAVSSLEHLDTSRTLQ